MESGRLLLIRQEESFSAGFCVLNRELPELKKNLSYLHPKELEYFETLQWPKRQLSYLLGRFTAKGAIQEIIGKDNYGGTWIKTGVFNQPVVKNSIISNIQVSITHCERFAITIAFPEEHPMGIDLEEVNTNKKEIIAGQLSPHEMENYAALPLSEIEKYTINWTSKEALSKVLKIGLTTDFRLLCVESIKQEEENYVGTFTHFQQYKAISSIIGNYVCTIITPKKTEVNLSTMWGLLKKELKNNH